MGCCAKTLNEQGASSGCPDSFFHQVKDFVFAIYFDDSFNSTVERAGGFSIASQPL